MVVLETLKCAQCGKQSGRALINGYPYGMSSCCDCDTLICGICRQKELFCPQHTNRIVSTYRSNICIFAIFAPEDELRLIDLQIAMNDRCSACNCNKPTLDRFGIQQVMCKECNSNWSHWWDASPASPLERLFCKIISELNEQAMPKTRTQQNRVDGMLPVKIVVHCRACKKALRAYNAYNITLFDGEPHCYDCAKEIPDFRHCKCLSVLINCIQCIPENQLHLLTYSKWLKAVGCEQHRGILYELNAVSSDGTKTGKLRSFFKKEEISRTLNISETSSIPKPVITVNSAAESEVKPSTSTLSKMDPSIPDKLLPDRITCSCGREDELSNMFDCLTCSTYGVCALCLANKHWGHEMNKSKKTVTFCLINSQSEATQRKLNEMVGQTKDLTKEGEQSFEKLCEVLGIVFKDAMNSEDLHKIQSLLTKANTSEIEVDFKNAMNSTRRLHLLTYIKWLKAVGCEQHRDILYKLNAVSADGTKTGKLRSFFKIEEIARTLNISETSSISNPTITVKTTDAANKIKPSTSTLSKLDASIPDKLEDIVSNPNISETSSIPKPTITNKTTAIENDRKQSTSTLSNLDPSIPDKLLPDRITCSCGREDELSNMFDCLTCSTYGMCGLCLGKKHWGHEMKESKKTVAFCLINSQSETTRVKLIEMLGQAKDLNMEGEQSFEKLCHALGFVFKDAMLSEDLHRIQSLLTKANTSELEKYFKNAVSGTKMLYKFIDGFCEDLLEAVEEEKTTQ